MRKIFLIGLLCAVLCGCSKTEYKKSIFAMDTIMDLTIYAENGEPLSKAEDEIERLDALLDRKNAGGEIYKINADKTAEISDETSQIIKTALSISEKTGGAFDITAAEVTDLWGFYGGNFRVPAENELQKALDGVGYEKVQLDENKITIPENMSLDLGGIGKGYASDRIAGLLCQDGVESAIISLGGNVYALGSRYDGRAWQVGIADPADKSKIIGTISVTDKAVVTSGGYQRYFEKDGVRYHHIIDPKTGKSAKSGLASVTVIADSGTKADGLSTALFVMGLDGALKLWKDDGGFEAVFADDGGNIYVTAGIADAFKSERKYSVINY